MAGTHGGFRAAPVHLGDEASGPAAGEDGGKVGFWGRERAEGGESGVLGEGSLGGAGFGRRISRRRRGRRLGERDLVSGPLVVVFAVVLTLQVRVLRVLVSLVRLGRSD